MMKSLSVFVTYCLLNIYEGILISASPMSCYCQYACKCFTLSVKLYCSTMYKIFSPIYTNVVCQEISH